MDERRHHALRRFVVDEIRPQEGRISIQGQEARHIARVLRLHAGDRVILMDRNGARFLAKVESAHPQEVIVSIEEPLQSPSSSPLRITLCQALLRSGPMDFVIQKASELGIAEIFPFFSERTVVRSDRTDTANKLRHWNEIARGASKQSGRERLPEIHPVLPFSELLAGLDTAAHLKVILWEGEETRDFKGTLRNHGPATKATGIIGPEGGFAEKEIDAALSAGFIPVSMGQRILRAETAAIAFVAIVQYEWGDLG